ncbi:MAG: NAD(P)-binding protein, partial [Hasllibacter sp.]
MIGAGFGGLACALRRAAAGDRVTVLDRAAAPGGKARARPTLAGPAQAGPTVVTMRPAFDELFAAAGARLDDHVALTPEPILARHFWRDGTTLDLHPCAEASAAAIDAFAGPAEADAFRAFAAEARALFDAFDAPMMRAARPRLHRLAAAALARPRHLGALLPGRTLQGRLNARFRDPRLRQLFGRYATYVGGSPRLSPALLGLIYHSEASGVWRVDGGRPGRGGPGPPPARPGGRGGGGRPLPVCARPPRPRGRGRRAPGPGGRAGGPAPLGRRPPARRR